MEARFFCVGTDSSGARSCWKEMRSIFFFPFVSLFCEVGKKAWSEIRAAGLMRKDSLAATKGKNKSKATRSSGSWEDCPGASGGDCNDLQLGEGELGVVSFYFAMCWC